MNIVKLKKLIKKKKDKCFICQQGFKLNYEVSYLPCAHLFHLECIERWLIDNNNCPECNIKFDIGFHYSRIKKMVEKNPRFDEIDYYYMSIENYDENEDYFFCEDPIDYNNKIEEENEEEDENEEESKFI